MVQSIMCSHRVEQVILFDFFRKPIYEKYHTEERKDWHKDIIEEACNLSTFPIIPLYHIVPIFYIILLLNLMLIMERYSPTNCKDSAGYLNNKKQLPKQPLFYCSSPLA
jgi:hypothetical protein